MKGLIIELELTAITRGPCEACQGNTWTYRVVESHTTISFCRAYKWCEPCLYGYAEEYLAMVHDRLREETISFEEEKRSVVG